jgi:hypothetical protein
MMPGLVNTAGGELFHAIAREEFSSLLHSVRTRIVRVDMQSSIRALIWLLRHSANGSSI